MTRFSALAAAVFAAALVPTVGAAARLGATGAAPARPAVHLSGRWVVTVRRHGKIVRRVSSEGRASRARATESDLVGAAALPMLLAGTRTAGTWSLQGTESTSTKPLTAPATAQALPGTDDSLVVSGRLAASAKGTITSLGTSLGLCPPTVAPSKCSGGAEAMTALTKKDGLDVAVSAGDQVTFLVQLTFTGGNNLTHVLPRLLLGQIVPSKWYVAIGNSIGSGPVASSAAGYTGVQLVVSPEGGRLQLGATAYADSDPWVSANTYFTDCESGSESPVDCANPTISSPIKITLILPSPIKAPMIAGQEVVFTVAFVFS